MNLHEELKAIDRLLFQGGDNAQEITKRMDILFTEVHEEGYVVDGEAFTGLSSGFLQTVLMGWVLSFLQFRDSQMEAYPSGLN